MAELGWLGLKKFAAGGMRHFGDTALLWTTLANHNQPGMPAIRGAPSLSMLRNSDCTDEGPQPAQLLMIVSVVTGSFCELSTELTCRSWKSAPSKTNRLAISSAC